MHRGLSGRVASAGDVYMLVLDDRSLAGARAVEQARAEKLVLVRQTQAPVVDAGRAYRRTRDDPGSVFEVADALSGGELSSYSLARQENLGAEAACLLARPFREFRSADPLWESK